MSFHCILYTTHYTIIGSDNPNYGMSAISGVYLIFYFYAPRYPIYINNSFSFGWKPVNEAVVKLNIFLDCAIQSISKEISCQQHTMPFHSHKVIKWSTPVYLQEN